MWLLIRNMLLRLFVNMCVSIWVVFIVLIALRIALTYALRIFWYHGNLFDIRELLLGLYIPEHAVLPTICSSEFTDGGMKEPSVYMQCCGWNVTGWMCSYLTGKGVVIMILSRGFVLGAIFHVLENLTLYIDEVV